jgi:hypothetical protein
VNDIAAISFVVFLACGLLSLFYWTVVQPVFLRALQFRLFARRDAVRRQMIESSTPTFAHRHLEGFICKAISFIPSMNLVTFAKFAANPTASEAAEAEVKRFKAEAPEELLELKHNSVKDCILIMMLNSPIAFVFAAILGFVLWVLGRFAHFYRRTESFVSQFPDSKIPQAA